MPGNDEQAYEYLKKTREQHGLSISDVANALHLNVALIERIEVGDFSNRRFAPVFMRGYIRSYAKYLNLPDDIAQQIISAVDMSPSLTVTTFAKKVPSASKKHVSADRISKILVYLVVVIALIIGAFFWHSSHKTTLSMLENTIENIADDANAAMPVGSATT